MILNCLYYKEIIKDLRKMALTQDELKQQVAKAAVEYVREGIIGVGTGSTANFFIEELAKVKHRIDWKKSVAMRQAKPLVSDDIRT